jgi:hypothetical protein
MIVVAMTGLISLVLFGIALLLFLRASVTPSSQIRTESRRSPAEYAHHRQQSVRRRSGYMLVMAATVTLGICVTMGIVLVASD